MLSDGYNDIWTEAMHEIIESLETRMHVTETLNKLYEKLIKAICYEMDEYLESKYVSRKSRKMYKNSKPYWNDDLTSKWKQMVEDENKFKKFKGHGRQKNRLKLNFDISRNVFDKSLRQTERKYNN